MDRSQDNARGSKTSLFLDRKCRVSMTSPRDMDNEVGEAISAFKSGRPVMIYDSDYRDGN